MQDMEFTIEDRKLYMLQTRNGKRTAAARHQIACDLIDEGMISERKPFCENRSQTAGFFCCTLTFDPDAALKRPRPSPPRHRRKSRRCRR